jgi:hypothetical protein
VWTVIASFARVSHWVHLRAHNIIYTISR